MKKIFFFFLISLISSGLFAQVPEAKYFNKIEGSVWQTAEQIDQETIADLKEFGLSILETDLNPLKSNAIIWTFTKTLTIESLDAHTKKKSLLLECPYLHNRENKTLTLVIDNQKLVYSYVPVSTGAYVGFTKKEKNTPTTNNKAALKLLVYITSWGYPRVVQGLAVL